MLSRPVQVHLLRSAPAALRPLRWQSSRDAFASQLAALRSSARALSARDAANVARTASVARGAATMRGGVSGSTSTRATSSGDVRATLAPWLGTAKQRALADSITRAAEHVGVAPELSLAVAVAESSLDPRARSSDGLSSGTFQVTAPTAADTRRRFASRELTRPPGGDDVALGVAHLRYLDQLFDRDASLGRDLRTVAVDDPGERSRFAVAAYNAGEGRVAQAQERAAALKRDPTRFESIRPFLPRITQRYVDRVMRYAGRDAATGNVARTV